MDRFEGFGVLVHRAGYVRERLYRSAAAENSHEKK